MGLFGFLGLGCRSDVGEKPLTSVSKGRGCTDVPCFLAFVAFWIVMAVILGQAVDRGDMDKIIRAVDWQGRICGRSAGVEDLPYGAWPDVNQFNFKVCVETCNHTTTSLYMGCYEYSVSGGSIGYNVASPQNVSSLYDAVDAGRVSGAYNGVVDKDGNVKDETLRAQLCPQSGFGTTEAELGYNTIQFLGYCLPFPSGVNGNSTYNSLSSIPGFDGASETLGRAVGDIQETWEIILASFFIAIGVAFVYTFLMRLMAKTLVWTSVLAVAAAIALIGYVLLKKAEEYEEPGAPKDGENRVKALRWVGWSFIVTFIIYLLVILFMRKRINIAVEVVKEAARCLSDMKAMLFFPVFPLAAGAATFVFFIYSALFIFSVTVDNPEYWPKQDIVTCDPANFVQDNCAVQTDYYVASSVGSVANLNDAFFPYVEVIGNGTAAGQVRGWTEQKWDESMRNSFLVHFFGFLWNIQFWIYFCYFTIAGAVADWYFTERDARGKKKRGGGEGELTSWPVLSSVKRLLRYHLGTITFGAALIAIVQFLRAIVTYLDATTQGGTDNKVAKCALKIVICCLRCAECCLDKISKNGFVWCAIYGDCFMASGMAAFKLLWRNLARVAAINAVSGFLMFLGKIFVACVTTCICGLIIMKQDDVSSPIIPCLIIFLLAFMVGSLFMVLYDTSIDTIFLCFLIDEECNKGGQMFASKGLLHVINKYADESEAKAERAQSMSPRTKAEAAKK